MFDVNDLSSLYERTSAAASSFISTSPLVGPMPFDIWSAIFSALRWVPDSGLQRHSTLSQVCNMDKML